MSAHGGQNVVEDGLVFCIDPTDPKSYIGSGATMYDRIEGKLTGTIVGSPTYNKDYFDVNDTQYINFPDANQKTQFTSTDSFSAFLWVKIPSGQTGLRGIYGNSAYLDGGWQISFLNNLICVVMGRSGVTYYPIFGDWIFDEFVYFGFTYNQTLMKVYMNGRREGPTRNNDITKNTNPIRIGTGTQGGWDRFTGSIGLAQVYNRALTDEEVLQNYNTTKSRYQK